jgi:sensor c-di-GMP phosphodiesterase-like protein
LLPIDKLKIDRSFVVAMDDQRQKAILSIMIQLAKLLGLETVSEGVETKKQFEALKTLGIDLIQGWYFSKALPIDDFIQYYNQSMELDK